MNYRLRHEEARDTNEINRLLQRGFPSGHRYRNIWKLRQGERIEALSLVAASENDANILLGSIRFWPIKIAGVSSVLLGPLAVDPQLRGQGIGRALVYEGLERAKQNAWQFCFVSGDHDYYTKFGFVKLRAIDLILPAPIEDERLHIIALGEYKLADLSLPLRIESDTINPYQ